MFIYEHAGEFSRTFPNMLVIVVEPTLELEILPSWLLS